LRHKATAALPPENPPARPVPPAPLAASTVQALGQQLRDLLPPRRLHSVSVCDHEANVLWLSEGALGPDEHVVVDEALGVLAADSSMPCHEMGLEDGRHALFLPVRSPTGNLVGITMILADNKSVGDDTQERVTAAPVRAIMQRLAVLMKPDGQGKPDAPAAPLSAQDLAPLRLELVPEIAAATPPAPVTREPARAFRSSAGQPPAAPPTLMSAAEVNDILEFDLGSVDSPRVALRAAAQPSGETSSGMLHLEFLADPLDGPVPPEPVPPPAAQPAKVAQLPVAAPAAPSARPAAAKVMPSSVPTLAAAPAAAQMSAPIAMAMPVNDAQLILEVLPYAKLRAGGQTRRFQIHPRASGAQRDPAALDALILQRLLGWLAAHRAAWNSQPTSFTVNLSIATLEDERFAQKIAAALNAHGIAAETLGFEIAEALCTQRRALVERFINQCDKLGVWVVIDDFSFDSQVLPLLKSKAVRLVKINSKLTSSALKDKLSQALVVATVQAAKVMGIHCGAKKVDSQAALQWLTAIGCDFAQGAALSPAQPLDSLASSGEPANAGTAVRSN
jgi:EAL domain-containing protein (putative c-di-GMP-specific phosphodiesterase class I)